MQADILVSLLTMSVEPTDSSYMPSLLTVSGGNSLQSLRELRTVTVEPNDRRVVLLDTLTQVTHFIKLTGIMYFRLCDVIRPGTDLMFLVTFYSLTFIVCFLHL